MPQQRECMLRLQPCDLSQQLELFHLLLQEVPEPHFAPTTDRHAQHFHPVAVDHFLWRDVELHAGSGPTGRVRIKDKRLLGFDLQSCPSIGQELVHDRVVDQPSCGRRRCDAEHIVQQAQRQVHAGHLRCA